MQTDQDEKTAVDTRTDPVESGGGDTDWQRGDREAAEAPRRRDPVVSLLMVLSVVLVVMVAFLGGVFTERQLSGVNNGPIDGDRLNEVAELVQAEYYRGPTDEESQEEFDEQLEYGALSGVAAGAGDPYTSFLPPDDAQPLANTLSGQYGGVGVTVQVQGEELVIAQTAAGGPAERAGVRAGDRLVSADGQALTGLTVSEASNLIRGEVGSSVTLVVNRPTTGEQLTIPVEREQLELPVVVYSFDGETRIARLQVSAFSGVTTSQLDQGLAQAEADGAVGLVLDLRGNGGGSVNVAQEMIGRFVPAAQGPALYETVGRMGESDQVSPLPIIAPENGVVSTLPLVVLVDGNTASASEIVAGALSDYGRATVMGEDTYGKGSVQRLHTFEGGSMLRVTIAEWLTPAKQRLEGVGVVLGVYVPAGIGADGTDLQYEAAARYMLSGGASAASFGW